MYLYLQTLADIRIETWLMALPAFYSFFCGGTMGTYLSLHFSVRARALSSLLLRKYIINQDQAQDNNVMSSISDPFHHRGGGLWKAPRQDPLVSDQASMDLFCLLVDSTGSLLHLDWCRICKVW